MIAQVLGYSGIPTTRTVREHFNFAKEEWVESQYEFDWLLRRERTVVDPIYVVPQMLPCPECEGARGRWRIWEVGIGDIDPWTGTFTELWGWTDWNPGVLSPDEMLALEARSYQCEPCEPCEGSGVVAPPKPDYIATEQCLKPPAYNTWGHCAPGEPGWDFERRQVVAHQVTAIDPFAAVKLSDVGRTQPPAVALDSSGCHWFDANGDPFDGPQLDLTPGQVVWRVHLEALEQPYTAMTVKRYRAHVPWSVDQQYHTIPLSVPVGEVADVELTR